MCDQTLLKCLFHTCFHTECTVPITLGRGVCVKWLHLSFECLYLEKLVIRLMTVHKLFTQCYHVLQNAIHMDYLWNGTHLQKYVLWSTNTCQYFIQKVLFLSLPDKSQEKRSMVVLLEHKLLRIWISSNNYERVILNTQKEVD